MTPPGLTPDAAPDPRDIGPQFTRLGCHRKSDACGPVGGAPRVLSPLSVCPGRAPLRRRAPLPLGLRARPAPRLPPGPRALRPLGQRNRSRRAGSGGGCGGNGETGRGRGRLCRGKKQDSEPQGHRSRWSHGLVPNFAGNRGGRLRSAPRRGRVSGATASHAPGAVISSRQYRASYLTSTSLLFRAVK